MKELEKIERTRPTDQQTENYYKMKPGSKYATQGWDYTLDGRSKHAFTHKMQFQYFRLFLIVRGASSLGGGAT